MKKLIILSLLVCGFELFAREWKPDDKLLHAIRHVESSGGRFTYGDGGRSLGDFQISKAAWTDVNNWRKARGVTTYDYRRYVYNKQINRQYAADYLSILHQQLQSKLGRKPTAGELYAGYNMGLRTFGKECGFDLSRVNKTTARKCEIINSMLKENDAS